MNHELEALLQVQLDDEHIREIHAQRDGLAPRLVTLDRTRKRAADEVQKSALALERELERQRALEQDMAEHRDRHEKNLDVLNHAHKEREATAAMAQVEAARKVLADEESDSLALSRRITDLRTATAASTDALAALEAEQAEQRADVERERAAVAQALGTAQTKRATSAEGVSPSMLSKYDRIQMRRNAAAIYPLHADFSCGSCDTGIPLQRRPSMAGGQKIEICEGCGVLLYMPIERAPG